MSIALTLEDKDIIQNDAVFKNKYLCQDCTEINNGFLFEKNEEGEVVLKIKKFCNEISFDSALIGDQTNKFDFYINDELVDSAKYLNEKEKLLTVNSGTQIKILDTKFYCYHNYDNVFPTIIAIKKRCTEISFNCELGDSYNKIHLYIDGEYKDSYSSINRTETKISGLSDNEHEIVWTIISFSNTYNACLDNIRYTDSNGEHIITKADIIDNNINLPKAILSNKSSITLNNDLFLPGETQTNNANGYNIYNNKGDFISLYYKQNGNSGQSAFKLNKYLNQIINISFKLKLCRGYTDILITDNIDDINANIQKRYMFSNIKDPSIKTIYFNNIVLNENCNSYLVIKTETSYSDLPTDKIIEIYDIKCELHNESNNNFIYSNDFRIASIKYKCTEFSFKCRVLNKMYSRIYLFIDGVYYGAYSNYKLKEITINELIDKEHIITWILVSSNPNSYSYISDIKYMNSEGIYINIGYNDINNILYNNYIPKIDLNSIIKDEYKNGSNSTIPFFNNEFGFKAITIKKKCIGLSFYYKVYNSNYDNIYLYIDGIYKGSYRNNNGSWVQAIISDLSNEEHTITWVLYSYNTGTYSCIDTIKYIDSDGEHNITQDDIADYIDLPKSILRTDKKVFNNDSTVSYNNQDYTNFVTIKKKCISFSFSSYITDGYIYLYIDGIYKERYNKSGLSQNIISDLSNEEHTITWIMSSKYSDSARVLLFDIKFNYKENQNIIKFPLATQETSLDKIRSRKSYIIDKINKSYLNTITLENTSWYFGKPKNNGIRIISPKLINSSDKITTTYILTINDCNYIHFWIDTSVGDKTDISFTLDDGTTENINNRNGLKEYELFLEKQTHTLKFTLTGLKQTETNYPRRDDIYIDIIEIADVDYGRNPLCYYIDSGIKVVTIKKKCTGFSFYYKTDYNIYLFIDGIYKERYNSSLWTKAIISDLSDTEHTITWLLYSYDTDKYSYIDTIKYIDLDGEHDITQDDVTNEIYDKIINNILKYYNLNIYSFKKKCTGFSFDYNTNIYSYIDGTEYKEYKYTNAVLPMQVNESGLSDIEHNIILVPIYKKDASIDNIKFIDSSGSHDIIKYDINDSNFIDHNIDFKHHDINLLADNYEFKWIFTKKSDSYALINNLKFINNSAYFDKIKSSTNDYFYYSKNNLIKFENQEFIIDSKDNLYKKINNTWEKINNKIVDFNINENKKILLFDKMKNDTIPDCNILPLADIATDSNYKCGVNSTLPYYTKNTGAIFIKKKCTGFSFYYKTNTNYYYSKIYLYIDGVLNNNCMTNNIGANNWYKMTVNNLEYKEHKISLILIVELKNYYICVDILSYTDQTDEHYLTNDDINKELYKDNPYYLINDNKHNISINENNKLLFNNNLKYNTLLIKKKCTSISFYYKTYNSTYTNIYLYIDGVYKGIYKNNEIWTQITISNLSNEEHTILFISISDTISLNSQIDAIKYIDSDGEHDIDIYDTLYDIRILPALKSVNTNQKNNPISTTPHYTKTSGIISIKKKCTGFSFYYKSYNSVYNEIYNSIYLYIDGVYKGSYRNTSWTQAIISDLSNEEHTITWLLHGYGENCYSCIDTIKYTDSDGEHNITQDNIFYKLDKYINIETEKLITGQFRGKKIVDPITIDQFKYQYIFNKTSLTYPIKGKSNKYRNIKTNIETPIFYFKKINNFFAFEISIITQNDIINALIIGNESKYSIYTNYAINQLNNILLKFINGNVNDELYCSLIINNKSEFVLDTYIITNIIIKNINSKDLIIFEDSDVSSSKYNDYSSTTEPFLYKEYNVLNGSIYGSSTDSKSVSKIPYKSLEKYYTMNIQLNIGNSKAYINSISDILDEIGNKEIIPYSDDKYKGPQFLYSLFESTGIPFNTFVKFDGNIILNGRNYKTSFVKISNPIENTNNSFGTIQFLLSSDTKLIEIESKKGYYENDEEPITKGNIFGITFYPVIEDSNGNFTYKVMDNIENSIISQNFDMNCIYKEYIKKLNINSSDSFLNRILSDPVHNKTYICTKNSVDIIDTNTNRVIKHRKLKYEGKFINFITIDNKKYIFVNTTPADGYFKYYIYDTDYLIKVQESENIEISEENIKYRDLGVLNKSVNTYTLINSASDIKLINKYSVQRDEICYEIKFNNDDNYYIFKTKNNKNYSSMFIYKDNVANNNNLNEKTNINIIPSIVEDMNGLLMISESDIRDGYPKSIKK